MSNVSSMMESSNLQQKRLEEASSSNSEPSSSEQTLNSHKSELIIQCVNVVSSSNSKDNIGEGRETLTVTRSNSLKNEINKPTYLQIHRHSLSTGISSVNKLQGRYEGISKSTDNTLNANTTIHSKANVTENAESRKTVLIKPSISNDGSKGTFKSELTTKLFQPSQSEVSPVETKETTDANRVTTNTINNKNLEETPEQLLSKTKSNIEKLQNNLSTKLSSDTIEKLRNKYSPAGFGYPKGGVYKRQFSEPSKIPLPKPKIAEKPKIIPEIKAVLVKEVLVLQDDVYKTQTAPIKEGIKDENSNVVINLQHVESKTEDNVKAPKDLTNSSKSLSDATDNSDISKEKSTSTFSCGLCKNEDSIPKENSKIHEKKSSDKVFSSHAVHNSKNGVNQDTDRIEEKEIPRSILKQPQIPDTVKETEHTDNIEIDVEYSKIEFANPEDKHFIVRRSSSEDSIYKIESLLADFVMDKKPKEKKRSNSFRKLLTGGLFGRDKKKTEENKLKQKKDGGVSSENAHNESQLFDRNSSRRHTVDSSNSRREIQKNTNAISGTSHYQTPVTSYRRTADEHDRYTEMSSSGSFVSNRPPKYSSEHYLPMGNGNSNLNSNNNKDIHLNRETVSKYIDTSSSSSITIDFDRNSTYQNALIAQAEMRKIRESGNGPNKHLQGKNRTEHHSSSPEMFRDNPSQQAGNTSQNLQLVKPKALIPINSERPLPNPYHTKHEKLKNIDGYENLEIGQTLERNLNFDNSKPLSQKTNVVVFEDVYGTVFDCVNPHQQLENRNELGLRCISPEQKSSKSLESSKLKLPPNREKIDLQPRIRSPIPQAKVSTEKIIATELLKNKRSPSRSSTNLQEQPKDDSRYSSPTRPSSYQGSNIYENTFHFSEKASPTRDQVYPNSSPKMEDRIAELSKVKNNKHYLLAAEWHRKQREFDKSPAIETPQITTNVMVHVNPSDENSLYNNITPSSGTKKKNMQTSSPVPLVQDQASPRSINTSFNNLSLHSTYQQNSPSPSSKEDKQHILQNVEAFYWRELKKLKDKEEQDILNYRRQQIQFYGYVEDPVLSRRSRSVSPNVQRGRRSLSLPRDVRPIQNPTRMTILGPEPIPEGRPVIAKKPIPLPTETSPLRQPLQKNPNFIRNSFERSTIGPIGVNKPYLPADGLKGNKQTGPIFKRGSLAVGEYSLENPYQLCKRVSFESNQNSSHPSSWPTKNGFTKSPPTRRIEREVPLDDEVFLPNGFQPNFSKRTGDLYERRRVEREQYRTQQGYAPHYGVVQRQLNYPERSVQDEFVPHKEPIYVSTGSKKITVSNKVCDIYGQIHDSKQNLSNSSKEYDRTRYQNQDNAINSQQYGQIRQSGLMYGELKSPSVAYQSYNQLSTQPNFVRGTRLTASVNDMYKRYPYENVRVVDDRPPSDTRYFTDKSAPMPQRPLPPVPERRDSRAISVRKLIRGYAPISDNESGSEAGEVQRILQTGSKQNRINLAEEEWNSDGKSGRASGNESGGGRGDNEGEIKSGRSRSARREDPRRHTLSGDQHYSMAGQGGPLSRTMDLEGQFARGYPPSSNAMLFDDDPGIMSEVETSSTGFRRGGKQRSSLPVVRTPSKTLERPLGLVFLQYRNETKRALLPNEITSIDTVKALFVRSFPKQLSMEYLDSPLVKIYIHDSSKDMFYELEDVRSHLREIRDRSVLRLFESADVSGGLPMGGVGIPGGVGHFEDPSYFSEPEFDSEYQHQHIHKSKGSAGKVAPYYMGSTTSLPRSGPILRPYSPAVGALPPDRLKSLPAGAPPKPQRAYSSGASRTSDGSSRPPDRFVPFQRPTNPLFNLPDGYMSSPERGSRGYEDPYYSQYTSRSGSITPVIDEEVSDTELLDEQYSLYGVKLNSATPRGVRTQFPGPTAAPYDATRLRVEHMERQLANLTGLVQKALTQTPTPRDFLAPPGREAYRSDKSVSFEKSVSFSDEPPDMNSPKQHSPQHAEKDRLKPAPPPKPASLSPGQYDGRHIYRDLQLTPEMYNQLRGLQKKAKDLRAEVRNLRRMSQAQAHSVKETIRDTFIKIRAMLIAGGEQVWQAGMDQERVRLSRDEDLYKQEMIRLEKDLTDLEASVEELRGNVINRKTRVNMSDVENMALVLSKSSKTVADLKLRFPGLQDSMKAFLTSEMDKVVREEKFLKEEPERLESALRRCKKLTGTLVTLKRLASVQEQRLPCSTNANDGRISPSTTETPPITPTSAQHSKSPSGARMGQISFGGDNSNTIDSNQRPENALDALLDELQTFSKPHTASTQMPQSSYSDSTPSDPPAIPVKGIPPSHSAHFSHPHMSEIGRKGSMDSAVILPTQNLTVSTATGSLRRLHSYPSGSDTDNSPPIQPLKSQIDGKSFNKPPIPERNAELFQHLSGRRIPPPPPPRTSSKSPLASPTSPSLPPRSPATGLQHIQNVQNMTEKPQSQFEAATQNLGLSTLRRNVPNRSSIKDNKSQTLPRNIGSNLQVHAQPPVGNDLQNVSSSSCESVNSQDGTKKGSRKEELEHRHQELLKKQKALQEQYARLQQLQRGNNTIAVVPPAPDQLLKKTGSESNLLQKMGLQMTATPMTGSLTHLPSTTANSTNLSSNAASASTNINTTQPVTFTTDANTTDTNSNTTTNNKVYETDIL